MGTLLGKKLLGRMSTQRFGVVAQTLLALIVLHIAATQLYALLEHRPV